MKHINNSIFLSPPHGRFESGPRFGGGLKRSGSTDWLPALKMTLAVILFFCIVAGAYHVFLPSVSAQFQTENQWPTFQGDFKHTGLSPYDTSENYGGLKWYVNLYDEIQSSPVISADGTIYITTARDGLIAISSIGSIKWNYSTNGLRAGTPVIDSFGNIYIAYGHYFDSITPAGSKRWSIYSENSFEEFSPAIDPTGNIYIGLHDGTLLSVHSNGTERWNLSYSNKMSSMLAINDNGIIYFTTRINSESNMLCAVDSSGHTKWNYSIDDKIVSAPTIDDDNRIYLTTSAGKIYCIDSDGNLIWETLLSTTPYSINSSPALDSDGTIYVALVDNRLRALNPINGQIIWTSERIIENSIGINNSPAIGSEGTIYFQTNSAKLLAFDNEGNVKWYFTPPYFDDVETPELSSPAIGSDGTVYYGTSDGFLYAIGGYDGPPVANFKVYYPIDNTSKMFFFDATESYDEEDEISNLSFEWDFGDNSTGRGVIINHTYENVGDYLVRLKVMDRTGKSDTMYINITVSEETIITPSPPISQKKTTYLILFGLINMLPVITIVLRTKQNRDSNKNLSEVTSEHYEDDFNTWVKFRTAPIIWLSTLMIVDVITTYIAISRGLGYELNPLARGMLELENGYYIILALKFLAIILITYSAFRIYCKDQSNKNEGHIIKYRSEILIWSFTIGMMIFTVGNNMLIISP